MKKLVIIGAGPRGLAVALRAVQHQELEVHIVDPKPLSTWLFPNMVPHMQMRSPVSFDLVTFQQDLHPLYSLAKYMKIYEPMPITQKEVENFPHLCMRQDFINYLAFITQTIEAQGGTIVKRKVTDVTEDKVLLFGGYALEYDYMVVAVGKANQSPILPNYLRESANLKTVQDLCMCSWFKQEVNVVGSGQFAAELVEFLTRQGAIVNWITKHVLAVSQYPVPSCKDWGLKSALGDFYSRGLMEPKEYLKEVKQWGPTITPYIANLLDGRSYKVIQPESTKELNLELPTFLAAGSKEDASLLPVSLPIKRDPTSTNLPSIVKPFKSSSHPNVYFTGGLAVRYDGPRQGSLISSGLTAKAIITDVLASH